MELPEPHNGHLAGRYNHRRHGGIRGCDRFSRPHRREGHPRGLDFQLSGEWVGNADDEWQNNTVNAYGPSRLVLRLSTREEDYYAGNVTASGNPGNGTGTVRAYYYTAQSNPQVTGTVNVAFNSADSLNLWFTYSPISNEILSSAGSFNELIAGGTGKYANSFALLTFTSNAMVSMRQARWPPRFPVVR